ncbi:uncharacterized protein MELLADRAFT_105301 [Melampsora larici-populina 98AG31]|uniref:Uncharacterized protein n=1 Tax=Melampsora larici-populina (strain 98AG31 / pathotype 3-4-7) TaxID=747676 RepID=F4RHN6_MELLP|nr:uncharacterized protein MELLADRAFT_105301 [Melampsora larici-populina 98AG31]EGG08102.1 hypothetical protein MELLADRAFT_105301 [Melampsora larici-populina 98AG31]
MISPKSKIDPRRVVCKCQSHGCYKGIFVDAHGNSQRGVEVCPASKEAHSRADLRSRIESTSAGRDGKSIKLNRITLGGSERSASSASKPSGFGSVSAPSHAHNRSLSHPQIISSCEPSTSNSKERENIQTTEKSSPSIHIRSDDTPVAPLRNETQSVDQDVCNAADSARKNGLQEYDTSKYVPN